MIQTDYFIATVESLKNWFGTESAGEAKNLELDGSGHIAFVRGVFTCQKDGKPISKR